MHSLTSSSGCKAQQLAAKPKIHGTRCDLERAAPQLHAGADPELRNEGPKLPEISDPASNTFSITKRVPHNEKNILYSETLF